MPPAAVARLVVGPSLARNLFTITPRRMASIQNTANMHQPAQSGKPAITGLSSGAIRGPAVSRKRNPAIKPSTLAHPWLTMDGRGCRGGVGAGDGKDAGVGDGASATERGAKVGG